MIQSMRSKPVGAAIWCASGVQNQWGSSLGGQFKRELASQTAAKVHSALEK